MRAKRYLHCCLAMPNLTSLYEPRTRKLLKTDLKIENWAVERLLPYARNARTHSSDALVAQTAAPRSR